MVDEIILKMLREAPKTITGFVMLILGVVFAMSIFTREDVRMVSQLITSLQSEVKSLTEKVERCKIDSEAYRISNVNCKRELEECTNLKGRK